MAQTAYPHFHAVILCEDYGAKLWPIAREDAPACFAQAEPGSQDSMLTAAIRRVAPFTEDAIQVVTTEKMAATIEDALSETDAAGKAGAELLVIPSSRGTAFSIALASARIRRKDPQAVIAVFRADQRIAVDDRWDRIIYRAYQIALQDRLVVLGGEQPDKCADYTYIRKGRPYPGIEDAYEVRLFAADAPPHIARRLCERGAYWYTGVMVARAAVILGSLVHAGDMNQTTETAASHRIAETANFLAMLESSAWLAKEAQEVIDVLPDVSYEKAALEVSKKVVVVPTTIPFSILASLEDLSTLSVPTREGNSISAKHAAAPRCRNTTIFSQGDRKIVALGLRDVMVVELEDTTLIISRDQLAHLEDAKFVWKKLSEQE